jgi:hypothetical protein
MFKSTGSSINIVVMTVSLGLSAACSDGKVVGVDSSAECREPVAEAGADSTVSLGQPVFLNGSASTWCADYADDIVFTWGFVSVPPESGVTEASLSANRSIAAISPQFTPDLNGEYVMSLQITDGINASNTDYVVIGVVAGDNPPTADCGGSYEGEVGQLVTLDGSASVDPEMAELQYSWALTPPNCSNLTTDDLYNEGTSAPSFVPDCSGIFVSTLTVSDSSHWSEPVVCSIDIGTENRIPTADAGKTEEFGGCASNPVQLNGYGSFDPDGDSLTYKWALVSAPVDSAASDSNFSNTAVAAPQFTWDAVGIYTIQLQVYDGQSWSAPDLVDITIGDIVDNRRPIANAGDSVDIEATANCQATSYSSECADCAAYTVMLDGSGSSDLDGDQLDFSWSETSGVLAIATPQAALTAATIPTQVVNANLSFNVTLTVSDCQQSDDDSTTVTYTCVSN